MEDLSAHDYMVLRSWLGPLNFEDLEPGWVSYQCGILKCTLCDPFNLHLEKLLFIFQISLL